jgi:[ribosomal protein S5]-alanine N-acetyltransferase
MPEIRLSLPTDADVGELLAFELENRAYFESHINARPPEYYGVDGVKAAVGLAIQEAAQDKAYQYLVRDVGGVLVGRANLTNIKRRHFHSAELGYRIAQSAAGYGYAREAVRQVVALAFGPLQLVRIEATSRPENEASVRVLERNGFSRFGRSSRSFELSGAWYDLLHFELRAYP